MMTQQKANAAAWRKIAWGVLAVVVTGFASAILLGIGWINGMTKCRHVIETMARSPLGDKVEYDHETCGGLMASNNVVLRLREAGGGNRGVILSYEPNIASLAPEARWVGPTSLVVRVNSVDTVFSRRKYLGRDRVAYELRYGFRQN